MEKPTLEWAFDRVGSAFPGREANPHTLRAMTERLRTRLREPHRAYHNESHVVHVLSCLNEWAGGEPTESLVAAALYHDAIYDPTRHDNEAQSAELCSSELRLLEYPTDKIRRVADLILMTSHHLPSSDDTEAILLADADLHILGISANEYESYKVAIRAEYAHVNDLAWREGRYKVLQRFLERPRIYHGTWNKVDLQEARARNFVTEEQVRLLQQGLSPRYLEQ